MHWTRPDRLRAGDTVAVLSPSWGGPALFPDVYEQGLTRLRSWGLNIREYPSTRERPEILRRNPRLRARDLEAAFSDPEVKAIVASIGGDDSIRLLPLLDEAIIRSHPKVLMGYSDTTTLLVYCALQGMVTFHGPSVMAGFAQMTALPAFEAHVREMLFEPRTTHLYRGYDSWCDGYPDWKIPGSAGLVNELKPTRGWRVLQGSGSAEGHLFGGCIEVLEFMKGTRWWPGDSVWQGAILFLETSEEKPSIESVRRMLRNYGVQGVFDRISALLVGRPRDYSETEVRELDAVAVDVVAEEFGQTRLPIVTDIDFGHTDPQLVLPLGVRARIDCSTARLELIEPWLNG